MRLQQQNKLQQRQLPKLVMNQKMQQSIQMLKFNASELNEYLTQVELENPFIKVSNQHVGVSSVKDQVDLLSFVPDKKTQSLFDYLMDQVNLTMRKTILRDWVVYFIQHLDQNGYLKLDTAKLVSEGKLDQTTLDDALTLLWRLDPPGVGARNLRECLLLQLENECDRTDLAYQIVCNDFDDLVQHAWEKIAQKYALTLAEVDDILTQIKNLSAAPGKAYDQTEISYIAPDLVVTKKEDRYVVEPTKLLCPQITFRKEYYDSLVGSLDQTVVKYLQEKKKQYATLLAELEARQNTVARVGQEIVSRQHEFFANKEHPLRPLLLRDIAQKLQLHESTISRAVNGKYLQSDFGIFELRSFFSHVVSYTKTGEAIGVESIYSRLRQIVATENKQKPLSDQKIAMQLAHDGLKVSRRTVAKYREKLNIPASSRRKRF